MLMTNSFRSISSFGQSTIWKFSNSISEMKKFAGRDFEDMLQCTGPCFEGLFPKSVNSGIQDLLFIMACWHTSAKLCVHMEDSLDNFRGLTTTFTKQIWYFAKKICPHFETVETPSECATSICAEAARVRKCKPRHFHSSSTQGAKRIAKEFNIATPKFHSIVHYPDAIATYRTTDSYSTQMVCHIRLGII